MSPGKSILTLTNIQTSQGGVYECSAKNDAVDVMGKVIVKKQSLDVNIVCEYLRVLIPGLLSL